MFSGTSQEIPFRASDSALEGVTVQIKDKTYPVPGTVDVPKRTKQVVFMHPDYEPIEVELDRSFGGGWFLMDLLFTPGFGVVGFLIDGPTSAWYKLPPMVEVDFARGLVVAGGKNGKSGKDAEKVEGAEGDTPPAVAQEAPVGGPVPASSSMAN
jgi:hypothetical protein